MKAPYLLLVAMPIALVAAAIVIPDDVDHALGDTWEERVVDPAGEGRVAIHDVDGDGRDDIVLHVWSSREGGPSELAWYDAETLERTVIASDNYFGDAVLVVDVDGDGDADVIAPTGHRRLGEILIHHQADDGSWTKGERLLVHEDGEVKDLEAADLDGDGRIDLVARGKTVTSVFFSEEDGSWLRREFATRLREGLALADVDGDEDEDLVMNGFWLETPEEPRTGEFVSHVFDERWFTDFTERWQDFSAMVATADFDGDGRVDIVVGHSEKPGVEVCWYRNLGDGEWEIQPLEVVDYCHTLAVADIDLDGWPDVVVGETKRREGAVLRYHRNLGEGKGFERVVMGAGSSYKAALGDLDGDGDIDFAGALSWEDGPLRILENPHFPMRLDRWRRHGLGELPHRAVFVIPADVDGDGDIDLVAGGHWHENPGALDGAWDVHEIGAPLMGAGIVHDFDGDGSLDILGTQGTGSGPDHRLAYAHGLGGGRFELRTDLPEGQPADFLQGRTLMELPGGGHEVLLSWHRSKGGIQRVLVPADPMGDAWSTEEASSATQNEDLDLVDIDGDGDLDVFLGTQWLRREDEGLTPFSLSSLDGLEVTRFGHDGEASTDRLAAADVNRDGRVDLVAGCEGAQEILWFEAPEDPEGIWTRHVLARVPGEGCSMEAADFDDDGDVDVVVGEHRAKRNRVLLFENVDGVGGQFEPRLVDEGGSDIDHHDGTIPVDIDGDGDLDIVSIGWSNASLWVLENLAR